MKTSQDTGTGAVGYMRDVLMFAWKYFRCISICWPIYSLLSISRGNGGGGGASG